MSFRIVLASFALTSTFFAQTWADDVAPIIYDNCTICHRPDESGPFPLLSYRDVSKRAKMIKRITADRDMPPWHPVEGHGEFVGAMRLSAEEIATLGRWADAGAPEGDATRAPEPPSFASGWALGPPDLIVEMSEVFEVPADGPDIYRNFVIPLGLERDVHLAAIDVRPSARTVLHHTIFELDQTGYARRRAGRDGKPGFSGMEGGGAGRNAGRGDDLDFGSSGVGGWAVGGQARRLPLGLGRHVPAGSDLVLRSHFHPSGKPEKEKTTLGLYFTPEPPSRKLLGVQLPTAFGVYAGLDIPAGQADFEIKDDFVLPVDCLALSVGGHAHQVCREMQLEVEAPDGQKRSLFLIDDWKFNWQNRYQYREPVPLAAGTRVSARILYDNSADNPQNPYVPPRRIRWGLQSNDEMGSVTLLLVAQNESESEALAKALRQKIRSVTRGTQARDAMQAYWISRIRMMDANADGLIQLTEIPQRMRRMAAGFDLDGDGAISDAEIDEATGGKPRVPEPGLEDLKGKRLDPLKVDDQTKAHVIVFTTVDCPIANAYAPEIRSIVADHADRPLRFFLVHVDADVDREAATRHAKDYGYLDVDLPVLRDPEQKLAKRLEITKTPEVAIILKGGTAAYRGRIDDLWGDIGRKRAQANQHDLREALAAILEDKEVPRPRTEAVGCDLPRLPVKGSRE